MKVLVCIPCLLTGGTEIQTLSLVQALVAAGHEPVVACYFEHTAEMAGRYRAAGAKVILLSEEGRRAVGIKATVRHLWSGLRKVVRRERPDVAHVQYMAPGMIPILILRALGVKRIVATAHTAADIYSPRGIRMIQWLTRHILSAFQCITLRAETSFFGSASLFTADTALKRGDNHFTIYNNLPSYISIRETPRQHAPHSLTLGVVSRLEHIKGMDMVVPAFAEVAKKHPHCRLLVVGDGSQRAEMERQTATLGVAERVEFVGRQGQDALQDYYDRIDILLMPSRSEGFGLTAIEGMARGCVLVASDTGGLPEVVDSSCGLLFESENPTDFVRAITEAMAADLSAMSAAAVRHAQQFSTSRYNANIKSLYSRLLS